MEPFGTDGTLDAMANLTNIDPSAVCLYGCAGRVLIIRGDYPPSVDRDNALLKRKRLVTCVAGETEVVISRNAVEEHYDLSSPNQALVLGSDESFRINSRDAFTVVVVIEDAD